MNRDHHPAMRHGYGVKCPRCDAVEIAFARVPLIDSCGFEKYSIECKQCGASLVAIIDPADDQLLVTELIEKPDI